MEFFEPKDNKEVQILEAARKCFIAKGFHKTSLQDVANEAGISKGGLYFYFKSKDELLVRLMEHVINQIAKEMQYEDTIKDLIENPTMENFKNMIKRQLTTKKSELFKNDMPLFLELWLLSTRSAEIRETFMEKEKEKLDLYKMIFANAVKNKEIVDVDPELAAHVTDFLIASLHIFYQTYGKKFVLEDLVDFYLLMLNGLKSKD
ncbi:MAG: TetR/AcrR family transcriptional regulator [Spirochaetota bacterium]|nr:TetR/AcrR family transcriptional regulator [Spirochaetota bacterium]